MVTPTSYGDTSTGQSSIDYIGEEFEEPRPERTAGWQPHATVPFWREYLPDAQSLPDSSS
jgi:hypothetical protein